MYGNQIKLPQRKTVFSIFEILHFVCCSSPKFEQLGNPLIDDFHDNIGTFEFWWNHGLISDSIYKSLNESCPHDSFLFPKNQCFSALENAYRQLGEINPYDIYENPCNNNDLGTLTHNLNFPLVSQKISALSNFFSSFPKSKLLLCCIYDTTVTGGCSHGHSEETTSVSWSIREYTWTHRRYRRLFTLT